MHPQMTQILADWRTRNFAAVRPFLPTLKASSFSP